MLFYFCNFVLLETISSKSFKILEIQYDTSFVSYVLCITYLYKMKRKHQTFLGDGTIAVQFAQSRPTLCDPMDCSTLGFPVHHQLPELAQTHILQVSDSIQPSHPLLSPSLPAFNLSQHWGLFQ